MWLFWTGEVLGKGQVDIHVHQGHLGIDPGPGIDAESALRTRMYIFDPSTWVAEEGDSEFRASLGYTVSSCLKSQKKKKNLSLQFTKPGMQDPVSSFLNPSSLNQFRGGQHLGVPREGTQRPPGLPLSTATLLLLAFMSAARTGKNSEVCAAGREAERGVPRTTCNAEDHLFLLFALFSRDSQLFSVVRIDCFSNKKDFKDKQKGGSQCAFSVPSHSP